MQNSIIGNIDMGPWTTVMGCCFVISNKEVSNVYCLTEGVQLCDFVMHHLKANHKVMVEGVYFDPLKQSDLNKFIVKAVTLIK